MQHRVRIMDGHARCAFLHLASEKPRSGIDPLGGERDSYNLNLRSVRSIRRFRLEEPRWFSRPRRHELCDYTRAYLALSPSLSRCPAITPSRARLKARRRTTFARCSSDNRLLSCTSQRFGILNNGDNRSPGYPGVCSYSADTSCRFFCPRTLSANARHPAFDSARRGGGSFAMHPKPCPAPPPLHSRFAERDSATETSRISG